MKAHRHRIFICGVCLLVTVSGTRAIGAGPYTPTAENLAARERFQDARFGLYIHWGIYSVMGRAEWAMDSAKIKIPEYEKLAPQFNPTRYDPAEWVRMAKDAGMKYIVITSKHHDGFAMYDSKVSDYDIVDRTPYKKDVLKMLANECRRQKIPLFFYHSQLDWHHLDYYPLGKTGEHAGRTHQGEWYAYLDYMDAQLTELCTGYGRIGGIWFDGWWDKPDADWRLDKTYKLIHDLQPQALIASNHHRTPFPGEDVQMFEKGLPGQDMFAHDQQISTQLPLETAETMANSWGYDKNDKKFKSTKELIRYLVEAAGSNANFLLNIGPKPDGTVQPEFKKTLAEIGKWTSKFGESIYATRGGPVPPRLWGVSTHRKSTIYLHILRWPGSRLVIPPLERKLISAKLFGGGPIEYRMTDLGIVFKIPESAKKNIDTILVLETGA